MIRGPTDFPPDPHRGTRLIVLHPVRTALPSPPEPLKSEISRLLSLASSMRFFSEEAEDVLRAESLSPRPTSTLFTQ